MTHKELADRREAMREYKANGKTNRDVAEHFGVSYQYTKRVCKGIAPQQRHIEGDKDKWLSLFEKQFGKDWEVVGRFISVDAHIDIKCKHCGTIRDFPCANTRKGSKRIKCLECKRKNILQQEEDRRVRQRQRLIDSMLKAELKAEEARQKEEAKWHPCPVCGVITNRPKYCCEKCADDHRERLKDARRRSRIKKATIDSDISLRAVYERDKGRCYLCGELCDWNDYTRNGNHFIVGKQYPSIEHVIPLSRGGKHSWDNVRLAHHRCNTIKGIAPYQKN